MAELIVQSKRSVALSGLIDVMKEDPVLQQVRDVVATLEQGDELEIDLSGLLSVNSVTLSILLSILRIAEPRGCAVSFCNMSSDLFSIARVGGLDSILPLKKRVVTGA